MCPVCLQWDKPRGKRQCDSSWLHHHQNHTAAPGSVSILNCGLLSPVLLSAYGTHSLRFHKRDPHQLRTRGGVTGRVQRKEAMAHTFGQQGWAS